MGFPKDEFEAEQDGKAEEDAHFEAQRLEREEREALALHVIGTMFGPLFELWAKADNYAGLDVTIKDGSVWTLSVQRVDGKSVPARLKELDAEIEQLKHERDVALGVLDIAEGIAETEPPPPTDRLTSREQREVLEHYGVEPDAEDASDLKNRVDELEREIAGAHEVVRLERATAGRLERELADAQHDRDRHFNEKWKLRRGLQRLVDGGDEACSGALERLLAATPADEAVRLQRAIRRITVDVEGGDKPNGPTEEALDDLGGALSGPGESLVYAQESYSKLLLAMADDAQELREAAAGFFGGDFRAPEGASEG